MNGAVLLDTDVFSYLSRGDSRDERYTSDLQGKRICPSFMTVAQLLRWAKAGNWGTLRRQALQLSPRRCVVLPYDHAMADIWATIAVERARAGHPITRGDCWIAAAVRYDIPLVTHNGRHDSGIAQLGLVTRG